MLCTECCAPQISRLKPISNVTTALAGSIFVGALGHEGGTSQMGISTIMKDTLEDSFTPSAIWGHNRKTLIYEPDSGSGPWP